MTALDIGLLLGVGLVAGVLAGLFGIGGGLLMVPAMVLLFSFDQHTAQGTSLLVIIPAAAAGSVTHYRGGRLAVLGAMALGAGGVIGALIGSFTALSLNDDLLQRLFALFLIAMAIRLLMKEPT